MPMHNPAHPGDALKELMGDAEVTALATRLDVDRKTLSRLLNGRTITILNGYTNNDGAPKSIDLP